MLFYNLHTHKFTNTPSVTELVNQYPWEFDTAVPCYSLGIHPWYIKPDRLQQDLRFMEEKLSLPPCLAVGECGLDKRIDVPMTLQLEVFEQQILLAEKYQKPLVLHLVAAIDELLALKRRMTISVPIIIHGFSKNKKVAQQLLDHGLYLSFGKYLVRNPDLEEVFKSVPNNRFFLETDTMEASLEQVYTLAAQYKEIPLEQLQQVVATNWKAVFGSAVAQ
jgi:TatD DNase family protein